LALHPASRALTAGEVDARADALADDLIVSPEKLPDDLVRQAAPGGGNDPRAIAAGLDASYGDIVGRGQVSADEVPKDEPDLGAKGEQVVFAEIVPVEQDAALVGIVEPRQQLLPRRSSWPACGRVRSGRRAGRRSSLPWPFPRLRPSAGRRRARAAPACGAWASSTTTSMMSLPT
jgi:hypothetical protein